MATDRPDGFDHLIAACVSCGEPLPSLPFPIESWQHLRELCDARDISTDGIGTVGFMLRHDACGPRRGFARAAHGSTDVD